MKKILVVIDMQNDFISGSLGTAEAEAIVPAAAERIASFDGDRIIVTFDTHFDNYLDTHEGKNLPVPHCIEGTEGYELDDRIAAALEGKEYLKLSKSTFGNFSVSEEIAAAFPEETPEIELIGLCTDICVASNALILRTAFPEAEITVYRDCCAGATPESHAAALAVMQSCQINIR